MAIIQDSILFFMCKNRMYNKYGFFCCAINPQLNRNPLSIQVQKTRGYEEIRQNGCVCCRFALSLKLLKKEHQHQGWYKMRFLIKNWYISKKGIYRL